MADVYNSKLAAFVAWCVGSKTGRYAGTTSATCTRYQEWEPAVSPAHRAHEECHKRQIADEGSLKFFAKYLFFNITRGYQQNPYEISARIAASQ
jgi:hypothetical protein